jgi:hypothetical protein
MVERAHRKAEMHKVKKRRTATVQPGAKVPQPKPGTQARGAKESRLSSDGDPNAGSPYFQHLNALAERADRGDTIDTTGMTREEFLKAFLGR